MAHRARILLPVVASLLVLPAAAWCMFPFGFGGLGGPDGVQHPAVGQRLAALKLEALGDDAALWNLEDLAGRVVFLHFWGTWCPPCVQEMPHIAEMQDAYAERDDFLMLAVSCRPELNPDRQVLRQETNQFLAQRQLDVTAFADIEDVTRSHFQKVAGWRGYPATMILDQQGAIRGVWFGYQEGDETEMAGVLAQLLTASERVDP